MKNKKLLFVPVFMASLLFASGLKANNSHVAKAEDESPVTSVAFSSDTFEYVDGTTGCFPTSNSTSRWWSVRSFFVPEGIDFYRSVDDVNYDTDGETITASGDANTSKLQLKTPVKQTERYLTFYLGGGANEENLYVEIIDNGTDNTSSVAIKKFTNVGLFHDPKTGEALYIRVADLADYVDHYISVRVVDNNTGGFGIVNFGGLKFNQTAEDVTNDIRAYRKNAYLTQTDGDKDAGQYAYMMSKINETEEFASFRSNDWQSYEVLDFEGIALADYFTNLSINEDSSTLELTNDMWNAMISSRDCYEWAEHMPFNKHGNKFFSTHPTWTGIAETVKVLLRSKFTINITDNYMAFRIGAAKANVRLIDSTTEDVLFEFTPTGNNMRYFVDNGVANIVSSKSMINTMTEVFVDISGLVGKTVYLEIGENNTGDGWGLSYIDEIRFNLNVNDIKVELDDNIIKQTCDATPDQTFKGVVYPKYVRGVSNIEEENDSVLKAFNFLDEFYATVRNYGSDTLCQLSTETRNDIVSKYNAISDVTAKTIINNSDDYNYNNIVDPGETYYLNDVVVTKCGVVETINYMNSAAVVSTLGSVYVNFISNGNTLVGFVSIISIVVISALIILIVKKKKYSHR
ncbi:MAG: hypothetical protein ACI31G_05075 [Bacilli bacterium]